MTDQEEGKAPMEQVNLSRSVTKKEAAVMLGLRPTTVADPRWRRRVGLRAFRVGRALRFREEDLVALIEAGLEQ